VVIIETMKIGEFIRKKREEAKLSLRAVAKKAGISHVTLIDIEHGKKQPRVETLRRILSAGAMSGRYLTQMMQRDGYQQM